MNINRVILIGRITKDLEPRMTAAGMMVVKFSIAVNRMKKEEVDFISCVAFKKTAEILNQYAHKGSQIAVEGRLQTGSYTNQAGQKVYTTDVICDNIQLLDSKSPTSQTQSYTQPQQTYKATTPPPFNPEPEEEPSWSLPIDNEDLPF